MKGKELYIVLSLYSVSRWVSDYYDNNTIYYITDGVIIGVIGLMLYSYSDKDYVSKASLFFMSMLSVGQIISEFSFYVYNQYVHFLPLFIIGVTVLEGYKMLKKYINKLYDNE